MKLKGDEAKCFIYGWANGRGRGFEKDRIGFNLVNESGSLAASPILHHLFYSLDSKQEKEWQMAATVSAGESILCKEKARWST